MKQIFSTIILSLFVVALSRAQAPGMFNYQGVARNSVGNVLGNKNISLRLTIHNGSASGPEVYSETRNVTTNSFGLFTIQVGGPGAASVTGTIAGVSWSAGNKYMQIEIDPEGGSNYLQIGTTQLLSVPFSLYSQSGLPIGPAGADLTGSYPNPTVARIRGVNVNATAPAANDVLSFDGTNWKPASLASHPGNYWRLNGADLFNNNTGNTGIGTNNPAYRLDVKTSDTGYVALFENTQNGNGDGLLIRLGKTHPRWKGSEYAFVPNAGTQGFEPQLNQIRAWIYGTDNFSVSDLPGLMPGQLVAGSVCNLTNYITAQLNDVLDLPLEIGPFRTPSYQLIPRTTIFDGVSLPALPDIPSIEIGPYTIPALTVVPRITVFPKIPKVNCSQFPSLKLPVLAFKNVNNSLTKENEFITFADKDGRKLGAIRAQSIENFSIDYFDGVKLLDIASQLIGLDLAKDAMGVVASAAQMNNDYNNIGVEYNSGNGDYAEWLERMDPDENISAGDIVGVKGGKITKDLDNAEQIMAVSSRPIMLGNMPENEKKWKGNDIAFMGQIPVKITGPVHSGDYIVAKSGIPGYGIAVPANEMSADDYRLAVGRSWETNEKKGPKMVNTIVGIHNQEFLKIIGKLQQQMEHNDRRLQAIEEKLNMSSHDKIIPQKKGF